MSFKTAAVLCIIPSIGLKLSTVFALNIVALYNTWDWYWPAFVGMSFVIGLLQILVGCVLCQREKVKQIQTRLKANNDKYLTASTYHE